MRRVSGIAAAATLLLTGCSSAKPASFDPGALASGAATLILAAGQLNSLPTGAVYVRVIRFEQPALFAFPSQQHVPGFVYVASGVQRLTLEGSPPVDIGAGTARFHGNITHTHLNPGPGPSEWYFIAIWSSSAHGQPLVAKIANPAFESADFSPAELPAGAYSEVLRQVSLAPSGRSEAHRFGGLSLFFVLAGSLTIKSAQGSKTLESDSGAAFGPGVGLQELNAGGGPAVYLEMIATGAGREFEAPLGRSP